MSIQRPSNAVQAMIKEVTDVMVRHVGEGGITQVEVLAAFAILTGQALAMQDQRKMTPAQGMILIEQNIELGNFMMVETMLGKPQGRG